MKLFAAFNKKKKTPPPAVTYQVDGKPATREEWMLAKASHVEGIANLNAAADTGWDPNMTAEQFEAAHKANKGADIPAKAVASTVIHRAAHTSITPTASELAAAIVKVQGATPPTTAAAMKPGPYAKLPIHEVAAMLSAVNRDTTRVAAKNEIDARKGFFTIENTAFVQLWKYHGMTSDERLAFSKAGGRITDRSPSASEKAGTVPDFVNRVGYTEEATVKFAGNPQELSFPVASKKRRTMEQFLEFPRADIKALCAECALPRGAALRREIFDACYDNNGNFYRTEKERNLATAFRAAYGAAFQSINSLGPTKLDDEAVPALSGQMTAQELLSLPDAAAKGLNDGSYKPGGRYIRREVKTAYMTASSAEKAALLSRYELALKRDPYEYI